MTHGPPLRLPIERSDDVVRARQAGRDLAARMGYGSVDQVRIATAISELTRNILQHSGTVGEIVLSSVRDANREGLHVAVNDGGVGIADLASALQDGFSTSGSLGAGLPGSRRLMDSFHIDTAPGQGVRVSLIRWRR